VELATWDVPRVDIVDGPLFAWRGAHLDVARHFFDVDVVLRFIDLLAAHRMNKLHLHLNDDQGWRIEVPAWLRLTSVGAWRAGSPVGHENDDRRDDVRHGGFYDANDIATILAHARRRHVQVVPEIDLPGHAQAVLAAYPQFANSDEALEVWSHWGISTHVLNVEPATLDFAEDVVRYVASLFPGSPVHIGGDECPSEEWSQSPAARAVMREHGFVRPEQLQGLYTSRLASVLRATSHPVIAWDEVLDADVPPGTTICAWRSVDKGVEAARRGLDVIMAPMQYLYLDWLSSDDPAEPVAVAPVPFVTTWEKVYGFAVVPEQLDPAVAPRIVGAQVQVWTEYIDSVARLDYMAFPRLCAFSEVVWGTSGDVHEFRPRLVDHLERLRAMGVAYRPLDPATAS
jgi:hexosaminidase